MTDAKDQDAARASTREEMAAEYAEADLGANELAVLARYKANLNDEAIREMFPLLIPKLQAYLAGFDAARAQSGGLDYTRDLLAAEIQLLIDKGMLSRVPDGRDARIEQLEAALRKECYCTPDEHGNPVTCDPCVTLAGTAPAKPEGRTSKGESDGNS